MAWLGDDGNDLEVYFWDGVGTTQITNNSTDDLYPDIDGSNVVWDGWDGNDWEIYMATIAEPLPSISFGGLALLGGLLFAIALGGFGVQRKRRAG